MIVGAQSIEVLQLLIYASYLMLGLNYNISAEVKLNVGMQWHHQLTLQVEFHDGSLKLVLLQL